MVAVHGDTAGKGHSISKGEQPLATVSAYGTPPTSLVGHADSLQQLGAQTQMAASQKPEILKQTLAPHQIKDTQAMQSTTGTTEQMQAQPQQITPQLHQPGHTESKIISQAFPMERVLQQGGPPTAQQPQLHQVQQSVMQQVPQQQVPTESQQPATQQTTFLPQSIADQMQQHAVMPQQTVPVEQYVSQETMQAPTVLTMHSQHGFQTHPAIPQHLPTDQTHVVQVPHDMIHSQPITQTSVPPTVQKQTSFQHSELEMSTGEASVEDNISRSAPPQPSSDASLPPLPLSEAPLPALSHTFTPSPAQPSSVAESDSEGPPKIEFVDNRIKTLDEKLRTLLYQEHSGTGATLGGGSISGPAPASAVASTLAGGDESSELHSVPPNAFSAPPAISSDTSPHSTSSTTPRSSSTSPERERERAGEEERGRPSPVSSGAVQRQPTSSTSPPCSLLTPLQEPGSPSVLSEPSVSVSGLCILRLDVFLSF